MFGWSATECLEMPATRFFALFNAASKVESNRYNMKMLDLCDISAISGESSYQFVRKKFRESLLGVPQSVLAEAVETPKTSNEEQRDAVFSIFRAAKRYV